MSRAVTSRNRNRNRRGRLVVALTAVAAMLLSLVAAVPPAHAAAPRALVVLDPDDNYSFATWNGTQYTELPITYAIATEAKTKLEALCDTSVQITRDASQNNVDRAQRAAMMQGADVSMTLSLNNLTGAPWGTSTDGGSVAFATGNGNNLALAQRTLGAVTEFTGRPNAGGPNQGGTNGTSYPYPEFAALPGTYTQAFLLYMDENYDWPAIDGTYDGLQYGYLVDAVVTAIGKQLQAQGFTCGSSGAGQIQFPGAPSQAQLAALFGLGFLNYQRYGADPVNFATGNFLQSASLFSVPGPGGTSTDVSLTYNSQDPRTGPFGNGWSSQLTSRSQAYADQSVLIQGADGSSTAFTYSAGGYSPVQPGIYTSLTRTAAHTLVLTMPDSSTETFTENPVTGAGLMTQRTDRAGHTWSCAYTPTTTTVPGIPNPWPVAPDGSSGGSGTPPVTYDTLGALTSITDDAGQQISFTNDSDGHVTKVSRPDGAAWTLGYDSSGDLASIIDPLTHATKYGYDSSHRMSTVTAPDGVTYISNTYDSQGRVVKQVNGDGKTDTIAYGTDASADGTTTYTDTTGASTTFSIDPLGRVTKVVTPLGHTISTGYHDWDTTSSTDADGHTTSYVYDSNGNLTQVTDPAGAVSSYTYTAQGDLTSQAVADGRVTTYTVDLAGHTTAVAGPDGAHWQQSFDAAGDLTSRTDPDGNKTSYAYDSRGNPTTVTDAAGAITTLAYDAADRITSATDPDGRVTKYAYDTVGDLTSMTLPSGAKTSYTYQADGQVATVTDPNGGLTKYTYNNGLNVATITDPDGGITSYGYDSEYRRTSVTDPDG
jgi:YD repeat-containing protein